MEFNLTVEKKVQAEINTKQCINCGRCREYCPTGAIREYCRNVSRSLCTDSSEGCSAGCPLGIVPQTAAAFIGSGDIEGAYNYIIRQNPLPWICSQVCDRFCLDMCKRGTCIDEPVDMLELEKYILSKAEPQNCRYIKPCRDRVAVIGGGPAGISAACALTKEGYRVTIFEKDYRLGGAMNWGIPDFRLDKKLMHDEIMRVVSSYVDVRYGCTVGENILMEDIWEEGFSACLIAAGADAGLVLDIEGIDGRGVYDSVTVLRALNGAEGAGDTGEIPEIGSSVVIIGGGGMAFDTASLLARQGKSVTCAAIDDPEEAQYISQIKQLEAQGINYIPRTAPKQIILENGRVKAVELMKVEYTDDERGWPRPVKVANSEYNLFCDTVIFAVGLRSHVEEISKVETYPDGKVRIDDSHRTNKEMIFACGDVTGESSSVVEAIAAGKLAAAQIDACLSGREPEIRSHKAEQAPAEETVYAENIPAVRPQNAELAAGRGGHQPETEPAEDIRPLLRSAGIGDMIPGPGKVSGRKVAVAGGGIAGITAAILLAKKGCSPTIFEKGPSLGGSLRSLCTDKRIAKKLFADAMAKVEASGIKVVYNASVGIRPSIDDLFREGYEAVLLAVGETAGRKPDMKNADARGVFDIVTLTGKLADSERIAGLGDRVVLTGSDPMVFDAARELNRYCSNVTVAAPCGRGALRKAEPAVELAVSEGVNVVAGIRLSRINAENGVLNGIDCRIMENNLSLNISCDTLVLGGTAVPDTDTVAAVNPRLKVDGKGYFVTGDRLDTGVKGVFAIGDFDMSAPDAGRAGAEAVYNYLTASSRPVSVRYRKEQEVEAAYEIIKGAPKSDLKSVDNQIFSDAQAILEAARCMKCGYHREDQKKCMGCGICADVCPVNAVRLTAADRTAGEV